MKTLWILAALVAVGCAPQAGPAGERGPQGPAGVQGPAGPQGAKGDPATVDTLFFVDANNIEIGPVTSTPQFVDTNGTIWALDAETAAARAVVVDDAYLELYESDNCSTTVPLWAYPLPPRVAFHGSHDPSGTHRARGDRGQVELKIIRSKLMPDGSCSPSPFGGNPIPAVALPGLRDGEAPAGVSFYGPIHVAEKR